MHWQRLSVGVDQDENFTKEFLGHAVAILSRVWKQQTSVCPQQKPLFSISPKKIRQVSYLFSKYMQLCENNSSVKVVIFIRHLIQTVTVVYVNETKKTWYKHVRFNPTEGFINGT